MRRTRRRSDAFNRREWPVDHRVIQENQSGSRLVLRRRGNPIVDGQLREKCCNLPFTDVPRMASIVELDVSPNPMNVGLLGSAAVSALAQASPHDLHEPVLSLGVRWCAEMELRDSRACHASRFWRSAGGASSKVVRPVR